MNLEPGYFYHIYNRGNNSRQLFYNRENYLFFLRKMKDNLSPFVSFISWCLMPNHFHLIVFVHEKDIEIKKEVGGQGHTITSSDSMTKTRTINYSIGILLRSYTRVIQKQKKFSGSLFQQHAQAKALIDEIEITPSYWNTAFGTQINISEGKSYLETCIEYVHQNPVYSGLVKMAEEWEYSSFRDYIGYRKSELLDYEMLKMKDLLLSTGHNMTRSHTMAKYPIKRNICIIGIGSNINAETSIPQMLRILKTNVEVLKVSSFIQTKPVGITNQPDFTNGAVKIQTKLDRNNLNKLLKSIEDKMGRDRTGPKFGPRCIDLDIAVWNGEIVDDDYYKRDFLKKSIEEVK